MRTEVKAINSNNMQEQQNNQQELSQHQLHFMNHISQDHLTAEQHQHAFAHVSSPIIENTISLTEGFHATTPQQQLTSECYSQYYSGTSTSSSSSSASSNSISSSEESIHSRSEYLANQTCKKNKHNASIGVNLRVTGQCSQGGRKYMEDYFSVAYQQSENAKDLEYAFIGIYDGHGGAEAAKFAKEHLMMEIINQRLFWSDNDHDVLRAIREGYIATHYAMWREQDKWPKTANGLPSTAGTTATVAFIRREKIYIGHVGDSGIVLGYQNENENFWRAKQLTIDHKPESVEERTRIINSGGKVVVKSGVPRVVWNRPRNASHRGPIRKKTLTDEIPFLAVARSLGDLWSYNSQSNEFVVSPDPDVKVIPINSNTFRCLIFGTDGLWNVVSAQEAVNTVREKEVINEHFLAQRGDKTFEGNQLANPSKSLVDRALHTWSNKKMRADNTSVVTVILYPPGQVDHSTNSECQEIHKAENSHPAFLQPISYGLEYTQVQAEVPVEDDATTYKEMALKYQPPEAYRNFNYYSEDSDTEGNDNVECEEEVEEGYNMMSTAKPPPGDLQQNTNYQQHFKTPNNWNWENNNNTHIYIKNGQADKEEDENDNDKGEDEDENEDENEDDDDNVKGEETKEKDIVGNKQQQAGAINYQNYVHMEAEETNNATDSYINTFADSYNTSVTISSSLLSSSCNSNSNSNSNCQSVTPPNMHDILQEQQLYQQQCMSEEEGYSLTKLETRREQLTCKGGRNSTSHSINGTATAVQTFKIFHGSEGQLLTEDPHQMELYHASPEQFYNQHQEFMPKPFELHSLLQQEREEEQQVAYERLQMENKLQQQQQHQQHQNISDYACLQTNNSITTTPLDEQQPTDEVEYLEEENSVAEEEIIATDNSCLQEDESVQINEISSSSSGEESGLEISCQEIVQNPSEIIEKIEILKADPNFETSTEDNSEEIKVDVFKVSKYAPLKISTNSICPLSPSQITTVPSAITSTPFNPSKRAKSTFYYNNVPNENHQRIPNSKYNHSMYSDNKTSRSRKRSLCITPSSGTRSSATMTPPAATSTPMNQRQLRSTTTHCLNALNATPLMDYGKRTLRTRNSLSKDMKAKSALVQAALKYSPNEVTRNFLRTTANNLIVAKPLLLNDLNVTPCKRRSLGTSNNVRTPNRNSIRTRCEKANVAINGSLNQCKTNIQNSTPSQLNLRSRETTSAYSSAGSPSSANLSSLRTSAATSTPVMKRVSLTERRILRSMHARSTPSKGSQAIANFSKSTRTQSTGSNLAAPPPSPKLINAVAAVAAATRARSMLNAKHAAAANGTQSVVSAVFGKRTSLRSNGTTHPAVIPNANTTSLSSPDSTHQTLKGRIVKKLKR